MRKLLLLSFLLLVGCSSPKSADLNKKHYNTLAAATAVGNEFVLHSSIIEDLPGFKVTVKGKDVLTGLRRTRLNNTILELESFTTDRHICIRTVVWVWNNKPEVDFWVYVTYGHTQSPTPIYTREEVPVEVTNSDMVLPLSIDAPGIGLRIGHGQGLPIKHFRYSFVTDFWGKWPSAQYTLPQNPSNMAPFFTMPAKPPWITDIILALDKARRPENVSYEPFHQSKYVPSFPGQTGDQDVFGVFNILPEAHSGVISLPIWRKQLYQEGCRPAHFLHPNGTIVTDEHYPLLVLSSNGWFHEHSKGTSWIDHTDPRSPWKDKFNVDQNGTQWHHWDDEHWALGPICQVYRLTGDPGLRMLIDHLVESWMFSTPVVGKGTTHHKGGAARAMGREIQAGVELFWSVDNIETKKRLQARVEAMLRIQVNEWYERVRQHGTGIKGRVDGYAPWEHGLWAKGLLSAIPIIKDPDLKTKIQTITFYVSKWILMTGFKNYSGDWWTPYVIAYDGSYPKSPSKGLTKWCLAPLQGLNAYARHLLLDEEKARLDQILKQKITDATGEPNTWDDLSRWRLF